MRSCSEVAYLNVSNRILSSIQTPSKVIDPDMFAAVCSQEMFVQTLGPTHKNRSFYHTKGWPLERVASVVAKLGILYFAAPIGVLYFFVRTLYELFCTPFAQSARQNQHLQYAKDCFACLGREFRLSSKSYFPILAAFLLMHSSVPKLLNQGNKLPASCLFFVASLRLWTQLWLPLNHSRSCSYFFHPSSQAKAVQQRLDLFVKFGWKLDSQKGFSLGLRESLQLEQFLKPLTTVHPSGRWEENSVSRFATQFVQIALDFTGASGRKITQQEFDTIFQESSLNNLSQNQTHIEYEKQNEAWTEWTSVLNDLLAIENLSLCKEALHEQIWVRYDVLCRCFYPLLSQTGNMQSGIKKESERPLALYQCVKDLPEQACDPEDREYAQVYEFGRRIKSGEQIDPKWIINPNNQPSSRMPDDKESQTRFIQYMIAVHPDRASNRQRIKQARCLFQFIQEVWSQALLEPTTYQSTLPRSRIVFKH